MIVSYTELIQLMTEIEEANPAPSQSGGVLVLGVDGTLIESTTSFVAQGERLRIRTSSEGLELETSDTAVKAMLDSIIENRGNNGIGSGSN